jgi:ribosomal protein L11 methyltransferase
LWLEAAVQVAACDAELVAEVMRQHCPGGVAIESRPQADSEGPSLTGGREEIVKAYLSPGAASRQALVSLKLALRFVPLSRPLRWRRTRRIWDKEWQEGWKRYFSPLRLGRRLVVKPNWSQYDASPSDIVIEIDPGMAFGTGQHPTTAMCLRALEKLMRPRIRVLDVGTGSGILAIAAAKLGAGQVLAIDLDPFAVKAAQVNARANGVEDIVRSQEGTLAGGSEALPPFQLVLANLSGQTVEAMAPLLARALAPAGWLVASGFLEEAAEGLSRRVSECGLAVRETLAEGIWRSLVAQRQRGHSGPNPTAPKGGRSKQRDPSGRRAR